MMSMSIAMPASLVTFPVRVRTNPKFRRFLAPFGVGDDR